MRICPVRSITLKNQILPTPMTNPREIKIFYARLLLALAFAVGLLSAFQDWELGQNDFDYTGNAVKRNYATVVRVIAFGLLYQTHELHPRLYAFFHPMSDTLLPVLRISINLALAIIMLSPWFFARCLSGSRIFWCLSMFTYVSCLALFIFIYQKYALLMFATAIGGGRSGVSDHISWLSGFYLGCAALFLHLCAMLLLFFPLRKKPAM